MVASYLRLRRGTYHCRIRVPAPLQRIIGRGEMSVSLRTGRYRAAARAALELRVGLDRIMVALEQGVPLPEIERRVRAWISESAVAYEAAIADNGGLTDTLTPTEVEKLGPANACELDAIFKMITIDQNAKERRELSRAAAGIVGAKPVAASYEQLVTGRLDLSIPHGSSEAKFMRRSILKNMRVYLDAADASLLGLPIPEQVLGWAEGRQIAPPPLTTVCPNGHILMSVLWSQFVGAKIAGKTWKITELIAARSTLKVWTQIQGDRPVLTYKSTDAANFRKSFQSLPANYYHDKKWKKIYEVSGAKAVIEASRDESCLRTSDKTFNKHLSRLNEFFVWAADGGDALPKGTQSICKGMFIYIPKSRASKVLVQSLRRTFSDEELARILQSPTYIGAKSRRSWKKPGKLIYRDHRYWVPLIGLLHGMRREESFVIKVKHVRQTSQGFWFFDLMDPELFKLIKDVGSPRIIAIHQTMLDLGFIEARVSGRDPEALLFPDGFSYSELKRHGGPFGKWFLELRRHCGVHDKGLDFHATRHTFINRLLEKGVPPSHVEELCGHEGGDRRSELATYDHGRLVVTLKAAIDRLEIPVDVGAMMEAVSVSDRIDRFAAWPVLDDGSAIPARRRRASTPQRLGPDHS